LTSGTAHHFYATIIDATFPYKTNKQRFICSLKIVDPSIHIKGQKSGGKDDYATLVLYANKFEDLPIVHRVGDIIRVHRAILRLHEHKKQFNASVYYNSSWALFSNDKTVPAEGQAVQGPDSEFSAFAYSGNHFSYERHEKEIIQKTRKWAQSYFQSSNVITNDMFTPLNKAAAQKKDFDVVGKIVSLQEKDEYSNELRIRDASGQSWWCQVLKLKFPHL
jgi:hypothetical protein